MTMHVIYNAETVEKIVQTSNKLCNKTKWNKKSFAAKLSIWFILVFVRTESNTIWHKLNFIPKTLKDQYISLYEKLINRLKIYTNVIEYVQKDIY